LKGMFFVPSFLKIGHVVQMRDAGVQTAGWPLKPTFLSFPKKSRQRNSIFLICTLGITNNVFSSRSIQPYSLIAALHVNKNYFSCITLARTVFVQLCLVLAGTACCFQWPSLETEGSSQAFRAARMFRTLFLTFLTLPRVVEYVWKSMCGWPCIVIQCG
jgi:hypothetical protein